MTKSPQPAGDAPAGKLSFFDIERGWLDLIEARQEAEDLPAERPVCLRCHGRGVLGGPLGGCQDCEAAKRVCPACEHNGYACPSCEGSGRSKSERELAILACDEAIGQYIAREVEKVDGVRHVYFAAASVKEMALAEKSRQDKRVKFAEAIMERIKSGCQTVMEMSQKKRINGRNGYLLLKGNGGLQPLDIYDPAMVPDAYKLVSITMPMTLWTSLLRVCRPDVRSRIVPPLVVEQVSVDGTAVREALKEPCPTCNGTGELIVNSPSCMSAAALESGAASEVIECKACGGSKLAAVPGARLLERSSHVEIK